MSENSKQAVCGALMLCGRPATDAAFEAQLSVLVAWGSLPVVAAADYQLLNQL